jgi:hypothetical protein
MSNTKRIRVPISDKTGYNREILTEKRYVVVWEGCYDFPGTRFFTEYEDALSLYEFQKEYSPRIEEALYVLQIKTIFPKQ